MKPFLEKLRDYHYASVLLKFSRICVLGSFVPYLGQMTIGKTGNRSLNEIPIDNDLA